jgi:hypothetical protein
MTCMVVCYIQVSRLEAWCVCSLALTCTSLPTRSSMPPQQGRYCELLRSCREWQSATSSTLRISLGVPLYRLRRYRRPVRQNSSGISSRAFWGNMCECVRRESCVRGSFCRSSSACEVDTLRTSSHKRRGAATICCLGAHSSHRLTATRTIICIDTITTLEACHRPSLAQALEWID